MLTGVLKRELWIRVLEDEQKLGTKADEKGIDGTPEFGFYFVSNGKPRGLQTQSVRIGVSSYEVKLNNANGLAGYGTRVWDWGWSIHLEEF